MKILALEREFPGTAAADFHLYAKAEAARVWELYQDGVIREMYFRADRNAAVLVLECADAEQAQAALSTLPLVQHGLIAFDVIPLKPYPGFARLFAKES
jgi:muconolactone delta-isomerase